MSSEDSQDEEKVAKAFYNELNTHGYGFHYSLLEQIGKTKTPWSRLVAEFPVQVLGHGTRIDFILKRWSGSPLYLIAECKRANPALSNWCFARAPFVQRERVDYEPLFVERARWEEQSVLYSSAKSQNYDSSKAYHIAVEVKSDQTGDPSGKGRGAIEDAATQVCRGLNGFVDFLSTNLQVLRPTQEAYFMPVIFTTAHLWASDVDLRKADLQTGKVVPPDKGFTKKPYLFYQYHLSPGIKHGRSPMDKPNNLGDFMDSEYVRTIAVVNPSGLDAFLGWSAALSFF
jgi:hypothetical protein